jgi:hypothetical protein
MRGDMPWLAVIILLFTVKLKEPDRNQWDLIISAMYGDIWWYLKTLGDTQWLALTRVNTLWHRKNGEEEVIFRRGEYS